MYVCMCVALCIYIYICNKREQTNRKRTYGYIRAKKGKYVVSRCFKSMRCTWSRRQPEWLGLWHSSEREIGKKELKTFGNIGSFSQVLSFQTSIPYSSSSWWDPSRKSLDVFGDKTSVISEHSWHQWAVSWVSIPSIFCNYNLWGELQSSDHLRCILHPGTLESTTWEDLQLRHLFARMSALLPDQWAVAPLHEDSPYPKLHQSTGWLDVRPLPAADG